MRIAVVCKDPIFRSGLQSLLQHEGGLPVAGGVEEAGLLRRLLGEYTGAVLLVVSEGLESEDWQTLAEAKTDGSVRLVLLASGTTSEVANRISDAVVGRSEGSTTLIETVRRFVGIHHMPATKYTPPPIEYAVRETAHHYGGGSPRVLTRREMEVAQLVAEGMPNRRIATVLNLQEQSVKNLVSGIMRKLDCENRVQVALRLSGKPTSGSRSAKEA